MRRTLVLGVWFLFLAGLTGCAGRDFKPPSAQFPVIGRTTRSEILVTYGKPYREGTTLTNGVPLELLTYSYAESGPSDAPHGGLAGPARVA
jgi:hypothetical protein